MTIYHLHLINTAVDADDLEGHDLPSLDAARAVAIKGIRGHLAEELRGGLIDLRGRVDVEDDAGRVLMTIPFDEAIVIVT